MNNVLDEFEVEKRGIDASFYLKMIALALELVTFLDCILVMFYLEKLLGYIAQSSRRQEYIDAKNQRILKMKMLFYKKEYFELSSA